MKSNKIHIIDNILTINIYCVNIKTEKEMIAMSNISNAVNMSFRVDKGLKKEADELFKKLGMNTSVALNLFLTQCVREKQIPFMITMENNSKPSKQLNKALKELDYMEKHPDKYKSYNNIEELKKALLSEE